MNRTESNFKPFKNRFTGFIVCWKCKKSSVTLRNLKNDKGEKTQDYACDKCWIFGKPDIGNQSIIYYKYD